MEGPSAGGARGDPRGRRSPCEAVQEREAVTDHDVAAFVDVLSASAGPAGRWIHFGLTSSDVLDTALALQLERGRGDRRPAGRASSRARSPSRRARTSDTVCVGRTHGVHAEPTTFGVKLAGFAMEAAPQRRAPRARLRAGRGRRALGRGRDLRGHVAGLRARACWTRLGLAAEAVSTQVVPRDRHAELLQAIALAGAGLERLATEIRHLQRTEVREVEEPFRAGEQKGSSAMPHKRNPINTERVTGLARVLRGYAQAGLENVALWHERDISHSGAERDRAARRDDRAALRHARDAARSSAGWSSTPTGCARTSSSPTARCSPSACCSRSWRRAVTRRGLPHRPGARPAGLGRADGAARAASRPTRAARASTPTRSSTSGTSRAARAEIVGRLDGVVGPGLTQGPSAPILLVAKEITVPKDLLPSPSAHRFEPHVWRIAVVIILGAIMSVLDTTIVNVALDTLSRDLGTPAGPRSSGSSPATCSSLAAVIPITGWAARRFGSRRALHRLARAVHARLRALRAGLVDGLADRLPRPAGRRRRHAHADRPDDPRQGRGPAQPAAASWASIGVPIVLAPVFGPTLGGLLVEHAGWQWIFLVNVPIGIVAVIAALQAAPRRRPRGGRQARRARPRRSSPPASSA